MKMLRSFYVGFGVAAYALFFGTFLYLIAFVGDLPVVPITIDNGPHSEVFVSAIVNIGLIALFGIQHSVMARKGFKATWQRVVPPPIERSTYVLFSSMALWVMFYFWQPIPMIVWSIENEVIAAILWAIFGIGWGIVLLSTFLISHFELFGLKQVWKNLRGGGEVAPQFRKPFFYKLVRHPLYTGFLLAFWAIPVMTLGHVIFAVGMTIYVLIAISYEEKDLVGLFGREYQSYQEQVGMLIPKL